MASALTVVFPLLTATIRLLQSNQDTSRIQSVESGYFKVYYIGVQVPLSGAND